MYGGAGEERFITEFTVVGSSGLTPALSRSRKQFLPSSGVEVCSMIRVLLIENQALTRLGVRTVIEKEHDMELVGEADNATDGFEKFRTLKPDVTILGLRFPDSCAIDDLDNYFIENPKAKIIVLAEHAGDAEITKALKKGAAGYICKDVEPDELITAIRTVA